LIQGSGFALKLVSPKAKSPNEPNKATVRRFCAEPCTKANLQVRASLGINAITFDGASLDLVT
jgi:hypothetical protein